MLPFTVVTEPNVLIQVRVSFYIVAILSVIFPAIESITYVVALGSYGIVIPATVGTFRGSLSRYHSMIIRTYLTCSAQILMISPKPPGTDCFLSLRLQPAHSALCISSTTNPEMGHSV